MNNYDVTDQQSTPSQPPMVAPPPRKKPREALLWGSIFGGIAVIYSIIRIFIIVPYVSHVTHLMSITANYTGASDVATRFVIVYYSFFSIIFFISGIIVGYRTDKTSAAIVASLWVNLWAFLVPLLIDTGRDVFLSVRSPYPNTFLGSLAVLLLSYIANLIICLILGVALGAFGGLIGRALARWTSPTP